MIYVNLNPKDLSLDLTASLSHYPGNRAGKGSVVILSDFMSNAKQSGTDDELHSRMNEIMHHRFYID